MTNEVYNDDGNLISFTDDRGNDIQVYYNNGKLYRSQSEYDYVIYYYNEKNQICYQEVFDISGMLIRKVWMYYNDEYLDHIVSDDGIDIWLDKNGNKTN